MIISPRGLTRRLLAQLIAPILFLLVALAACGDSGVGSSGTGITGGTQLGTVTGFGSIIVESNRYDDSDATVTLELSPGAPVAALSSDIRLGMQVRVQFNASGQATNVRIAPQIVGTVQSVTDTLMTIAGQTVQISRGGFRPTVFEGFETLDVLLGQQVIVYGQFDANATVRATRIEIAGAALANTTLVTGVVSQSSAGTIRVGELQATVNDQTELLPAGVAISVGDTVVLLANEVPVANQITAARIQVLAAGDELASRVRLGGLIRSRDANGMLRVGLIRVDPTNAVIVDGANSDLQPGAVVRVEGNWQGTTLIAQTVTFIDDDVDDEREVTGLITDFFSAQSFRVRGVLIDASTSGVQFENGTTNNLADGVRVEVKGRLIDGVLVAQRVEFASDGSDPELSLFGLVSNYQVGQENFNIRGVTGRLTAQTEFEDVLGNPVPASTFANQALILAEGSFQNGVFVANEVTFVTSQQELTRRLEGRAYLINRIARTLMVGRVLVRWNGATRIDGDVASLRLGSRVRVEGTDTGTGLLASRIQIIDP